MATTTTTTTKKIPEKQANTIIITPRQREEKRIRAAKRRDYDEFDDRLRTIESRLNIQSPPKRRPRNDDSDD